MDIQEWEVIVVAAVGLAGIAGTLLATRMANANAKRLMQAQWERDDTVAKRVAGKQAAKDVLSEVVSAAELFDVRHWRERREAWTAEHGRDVPEWLLGPEKHELASHYRQIRHRLMEIPNQEVVDRIRDTIGLMWSYDDVVQFSGGNMDTVSVGKTVEGAAESVLSAYIQERPLPNVAGNIMYKRMVDARDAAVRHWEEVAAEEAALDDAEDVERSTG